MYSQLIVKDYEFEDHVFPDSSNEIWLEGRHRIDILRRMKDYDLVGLAELFQGCNKEQLKRRLDLLDLSYLDPLTGIAGQEYFLRKSDYFQNCGVTVALKGISIEMINREIGYQYGNLMLYAASRVLNGRLKKVMRISFRGRKFLIYDNDRTVINESQMILARSCLRTSDGYEIKGIGIEMLPGKNTSKLWNEAVNSKILRVAGLTENTEWCDIYEFGRFVLRIEGALLKHLIRVGV